MQIYEPGHEKQICHIKNIVYKNTCIICRRQSKETCYIGELCRALKLRGKEHYADLENKKECSHMYKHQIQEHEGNPVDHIIALVKFCATPFKRHIREFIVIRQTKERAGNIINVKQEFNMC